MNAPQHNLLNTAQSVTVALATITTTPVPPALTAAHAALDATINDIQAIALTQALPVTGVTQDRDLTFATAADATLIMGGLVSSYARAHGLGDLDARARLTPSQLARGRLSTRVRLMQQVHDAAASVVDQLADFDITAATLADLQTKIDATHAQLNAPRATIIARWVATERLAEAFAHLDDLLHQIDPLIAARRRTDPDGYKLYQAARLIINRSGRPAPPAPVTTVPAPAASLTAPPATPTVAEKGTAHVAEALPPPPAATESLALSTPAESDQSRPEAAANILLPQVQPM